jgi:hypothetical protein
VSDARTPPAIFLAVGSTGSGKTQWIKRTLLAPRPRRLLVWDFSPDDEYAGYGHQLPLGELIAEAAAAGQRHPVALVFKPSFDPTRRAREFDLFCTVAYRLGDLTLLVEELRFVTRPSWVPVPWQQCILTGRKRGLRIIGSTQRPAHIDKDTLGNATFLHVGALGYEDDVQTMARELGGRALAPELAALQPLEWIELDRRTRDLRRGRLVF